METVIGQLTERFNLQKVWLQDLWHLSNRITRELISHFIAISVLLALWTQLTLLLVVSLFKKWLPHFYSTILIWVIINCFLLGAAMFGYISDLEGREYVEYCTE